MSLISGYLTGTAADKLTAILESYIPSIGDLLPGQANDMTMKAKSIITSLLAVMLEVTILSATTQLVVKAMPWVMDETPSFSMWILGIAWTTAGLQRNVRNIASQIFTSSLYIDPVTPVDPTKDTTS
jgi:hypothetical protein